MAGSIIYTSKNGFLDVSGEVFTGRSLGIFDMDGTLIDMELANFEMYRRVIFKLFGLTISREDWQSSFAGKRPQEAVPDFLERGGGSGEAFVLAKFVAEAKEIKDKVVFEELHEKSHMVPGAREFLMQVQTLGMDLALATSTLRLYTEEILRRYDIRDYFRVVVTGEDVRRGKPAPEVYNLVLEKTGFRPEQGIVFEDSESGVAAACSAGIDCVKIATV